MKSYDYRVVCVINPALNNVIHFKNVANEHTLMCDVLIRHTFFRFYCEFGQILEWGSQRDYDVSVLGGAHVSSEHGL